MGEREREREGGSGRRLGWTRVLQNVRVNKTKKGGEIYKVRALHKEKRKEMKKEKEKKIQSAPFYDNRFRIQRKANR